MLVQIKQISVCGVISFIGLYNQHLPASELSEKNEEEHTFWTYQGRGISESIWQDMMKIYYTVVDVFAKVIKKVTTWIYCYPAATITDLEGEEVK